MVPSLVPKIVRAINDDYASHQFHVRAHNEQNTATSYFVNETTYMYNESLTDLSGFNIGNKHTSFRSYFKSCRTNLNAADSRGQGSKICSTFSGQSSVH